MASEAKVGDRRSYDGAVCTIRYVGEVSGTSGSWLGVEWDDPTRGKHDGSHKGTRYFHCQSKAPTAASFVRPTRTADQPQSFVTALIRKYTAELTNAPAVQFRGKVAEEVGFDKIRRQQSNLAELKYAVLDGERIASAYAEGDKAITDVCPKIQELNMGRNLFQTLGPIVEICSQLEFLRSLRISGNRFQDVSKDDDLRDGNSVFHGIQNLYLEFTFMSWEEICQIASRFPTLNALWLGTNQFSSLPATPFGSLTSTLTYLNLEFNEMTSMSDVASLTELSALRELHLKGNNISTLVKTPSDPPPNFTESLQYLDVSYNRIDSWDFVDQLPRCFPGLISLRLAHNPIYDNPDPEFATQTKNLSEEAYMITVGRLGNLKLLNFGGISQDDRQNAEMWYLSRIGKHLATVPEGREDEITRHHARYAELCDLYGIPTVNRTKQINPAFLEARLVTVHCVFRPANGNSVERSIQIPKSKDIYAVKGILGRLLGQKPLGLRLIWETGEWDPVAGFDDEVEDSEDEEEAGSQPLADPSQDPMSQAEKPGKWIKREIELSDGPRQLGFCVDGLEAKVRVELR